MRIYIMRHGEAGYSSVKDSERSLTSEGISKSKEIAQELASQHIELDFVLVSPFLRAKQTWQAVESLLSREKTQIELYDGITPYGNAEDIVEYVLALAEVKKIESIMLVSHLPVVSYVTAEFATGITPPIFNTSNVACVEYDMEKRVGELLFQLT